MEPTLHEGQLVVARHKRPAVGDVVIALQDKREVVKRISRCTDDWVYLLGDNPDYSTDSRTQGSVRQEDVLGVLIWPRLQ